MAFKRSLLTFNFSAKTIAVHKGYLAEKFVQLWFWFKGYKLLKHHWLHKQGEIDLIFLKNNVLIFVEVKFRTQANALSYALSNVQHQRLKQGILVFQQKNPQYYCLDSRFDIVWLTPRNWPVHLKNVW